MNNIDFEFGFIKINTTTKKNPKDKTPILILAAIIFFLALLNLPFTYKFLKAIEQEDRDYFNKLYEQEK